MYFVLWEGVQGRKEGRNDGGKETWLWLENNKSKQSFPSDDKTSD